MKDRSAAEGKPTRSDLIKSVKLESEKQEGETPLQQGAGNGIRTGNGPENGSGKVGNTKYRREAPGGKPERVSTKEASV
ncbi:hypothetical protein ABZ769_31475, partial [Streptomyces olivoreticuli]